MMVPGPVAMMNECMKRKGKEVRSSTNMPTSAPPIANMVSSGWP